MVVTILLAVSWVWASPPAFAHHELLASSPADGATLLTPPTAVTLTFSDINGTSQVTVHDPTGQQVSIGYGTIVDDDPVHPEQASIRIPLASLNELGRYEIRYRHTDGDVSHRLEGVLTFTLAAEASPVVDSPAVPAEPSNEGDAAPTWPWLAVALTAIVAGAAGLSRLYLDRRARRHASTSDNASKSENRT